MSEERIVRYTSEELRQRVGKSDWAAADAMTEEEIEAAIASDPEEAAMNDGWMERATIVIVRVNGVETVRRRAASEAT